MDVSQTTRAVLNVAEVEAAVGRSLHHPSPCLVCKARRVVERVERRQYSVERTTYPPQPS